MLDIKAMKNKGVKRKSGERSDENVADYERVRKERITRNEEYMSALGLGNK
jgi:ketosteroid isomerase-like protein